MMRFKTEDSLVVVLDFSYVYDKEELRLGDKISLDVQSEWTGFSQFFYT